MAKQEPILISRPFGGWISTLSGTNLASGSSASLEGGKDQYAYSVGVSLFRLEKLGHMAPGEVLSPITDSGTYITALAMNGNVASTGNSFVELQNGRVVKLDTSGTSTIDFYAPSPHGANTIRTSGNVDTIIVKDAASTPNEYVIATWEDTGNTADAMIFLSSGLPVKSDWFSNGNSANYLIALTSPAQVPHKLTQGPDGNIYITNNQYIASATMAAGVSLGAATRNTQALNLGAGYVATGICSYQNYIATIGYKATSYIAGIARGNCRVWFWDGFSSEPNFIYDIQDNLANGIFYDGTNLYALTNGRGNSSKIFKFTGQNFTQVFESSFIAPGSSTLQGNMEFYQNSLHIGSTNGVNSFLYQYFNGGFHNRTVLKDGATSTTAIGMVRNLYQQQLFVGVAEGASGTSPFKILYQDQFTKYYVGANIRGKLESLPYKSKIKKIIVYFSQFGSGASVRLSVQKDYDTAAPGISGADKDLLNKTITNTQLGIVSSWSITTEISDINSFYWELLFNHTSTSDTAAIVRKIEFYVESSDNI